MKDDNDRKPLAVHTLFVVWCDIEYQRNGTGAAFAGCGGVDEPYEL